MPPLDLADPVRRRHYFQGFATGIIGGLFAAMLLPRFFRDSAAKSSSAPAKPLPLPVDLNPVEPRPREPHTAIPFSGHSSSSYGTDSPNEYSRSEVLDGRERTELPIRPDLPNREARGSNGAVNVPLVKSGR
jgi:hypothetical protein